MRIILSLSVIITFVTNSVESYGYNYPKPAKGSGQKVKNVFSWKQISYDFDGELYSRDTDYPKTHGGIQFKENLTESERFFIQYNNVPIGFAVYEDILFITVPRRRHGIPSTLNYVRLHSASKSPELKPYPDVETNRGLVSVYRPRVDECQRLWMVDTGLLEVPGERKQLKAPAIVVFDLKTRQQILRYELKGSDLVDERTPAGFTSITVDVSPESCEDAFAYITDLATNGVVVFSMRQRDSWRIQHGSFVRDEAAMNFTVAGHVLNWQDGIFSIALSDRDEKGRRQAFYHPFVSTDEFVVNTEVFKMKGSNFDDYSQYLGNRGLLTQSGSHDFHAPTRTLFFANVAQDAILCWNIDKPLTSNNVAVAVQDHKNLIYISDLKVVKDEVWVLVNQIPRFIYSTLDTNENNFYVHRMRIYDLIKGTACRP